MTTIDYATCPKCQSEQATGHYEDGELWKVECKDCGHVENYDEDES
jgi:uncharacterized metal-binding protein (TIGR02443 family)